MSTKPRPRSSAPPGLYGEEYFSQSCGGAEFFKLYGPKIVKPAQALALREAGLRPGHRILDAGCGRGEVLYQALAAGAEAVGMDFSEDGARLAFRVGGAPVVRADARRLPFRDGLFDRVFFLGVIDHLHAWELKLCFEEFARVLKPGGFVLVHTCVNRLYFKNLTYGLRRAAARWAGRPEPAPPRSGEDEALHVNEHSLPQLRRFFEEIGWEADVRPLPNAKLMVDELYPGERPADFPIKQAPAWKTKLYQEVFLRPPLAAFAAREFFAIARPRRAC